MQEELRCYAFVNFYLSSIQQGIQHGHAAVEMMAKYAVGNAFPKRLSKTVIDWANNHKTFITLNGGNHADIQKAQELVMDPAFQYPWAAFYEDEQSLGGLLTTVAVILPDSIFNLSKSIDEQGKTFYAWRREVGDGSVDYVDYKVSEGDVHYEFVKFLKSKGLAK